MPRLFTALAVPAEIGAALARYRGGLPGARWIEPSDYHVTLRFLGDVADDLADDFMEAMTERRERPAIEVVLSGLSVFGGAKPRAILASVAANSDLDDLQAEQERIARRVGAEPERRSFTPHVTLARLNRSATPEAVAMYLSQTGLFETLRFTARAVSLLSARASTGGGPYVEEAVFPFA